MKRPLLRRPLKKSQDNNKKISTKKTLLKKKNVNTVSSFPSLRIPHDPHRNIVSFDVDQQSTAGATRDLSCTSTDPLGGKNQLVATTTTSLLTDITFESLSDKYKVPLNPYLIQRLQHEGYERLTKIQFESIPKLLSGDDIMIRSETGSGKTLAFLVPAIQLIIDLEKRNQQTLQRSDGTRVLVLSPTRELVNQTTSLAIKLTIPFPHIVVGAVTGGEKRKSEKARLRKGVVFLGSTVGRLCDHIDTTSSLVINKLSLLVLDEADRLLDMGFEKKLRWLVNKLREIKKSSLESAHLANSSCSENKYESQPLQSVLVSATLTRGVQQLAEFLLRKNQTTWVGTMISEDSQRAISPAIQQHQIEKSSSVAQLTIPTNLKQYYVEVTLKLRLVLLISLILDKTRNGNVVVFLSNCESVEFHHMITTAARWPMLQSKKGIGSNMAEFEKSKRMMDKYLKHPSSLSANKKKNFSTADEEEEDDDLSDSLSSSSDVEDGEKQLNDKLKTVQRKKELEGKLGDCVCSTNSLRVFKLHGNLAQTDRLGYLQDFNKISSGAVLFTTDVAARGLNIQNVDWIIQVDPPQEVEEYVHRVGRTARFGREGHALLFVLDHEVEYIDYLKQAGVTNLQPIPEIQLLQPLIQTYLPENLRAFRLHNAASFLAASLCRQVAADIDLLHSSRRSFTASYRAYRCYSQCLKKYFTASKLHLGHLATAFGLTETPKTIAEKCRLGARAAETRMIRKAEKLQKSKKVAQPKFHRVAGGVMDDPTKRSITALRTINNGNQSKRLIGSKSPKLTTLKKSHVSINKTTLRKKHNNNGPLIDIMEIRRPNNATKQTNNFENNENSNRDPVSIAMAYLKNRRETKLPLS